MVGWGLWALRVGVPGRGDGMQTLWADSLESLGKIKFRCQREGEERHVEEIPGPKQAFRNHDSDHSRTPCPSESHVAFIQVVAGNLTETCPLCWLPPRGVRAHLGRPGSAKEPVTSGLPSRNPQEVLPPLPGDTPHRWELAGSPRSAWSPRAMPGPEPTSLLCAGKESDVLKDLTRACKPHSVPAPSLNASKPFTSKTT